MNVTKPMPLTVIRLDGGTQCRATLNDDHIASIAEAWSEGAKIPPVVVFHDGTTYWLADGFHRYHSAQKNGFNDILVEVVSGTKTDAIKYALGANTCHGLPRTNADKRKAVEIALKEFPTLSSREIAKICAVSDPFVGKVRPDAEPLTVSSSETRLGADGKVRKVPERKVDEDFENPYFTEDDKDREAMDHQRETVSAPQHSDALKIWTDVRQRLNAIHKKDPEREAVLKQILAYAKNRLRKKL